jgi:hypothetical protein
MVSRMLDFTTGVTPLAVKSPVTPAGCVAVRDARPNVSRSGTPGRTNVVGGTFSTLGVRSTPVTAETGENRVLETYAAALQHDIADLPAGATTVGVVRRPTGWFRALVDENRPALGPPESLLSETQDRREDLAVRGLCDEEAHNAAWEAVDFAPRYRDRVETDPEARRALADRLRERVEDGG